jgi:hypothetical protein
MNLICKSHRTWEASEVLCTTVARLVPLHWADIGELPATLSAWHRLVCGFALVSLTRRIDSGMDEHGNKWNSDNGTKETTAAYKQHAHCVMWEAIVPRHAVSALVSVLCVRTNRSWISAVESALRKAEKRLMSKAVRLHAMETLGRRGWCTAPSHSRPRH